MAEIHALTGQIIDNRKSVEDVKSKLWDLLEKAEAGEIVSIVVACEYHDRGTGQFSAGLASVALLGSIHLAAQHVGNQILKD